jgi:hypothetical protein
MEADHVQCSTFRVTGVKSSGYVAYSKSRILYFETKKKSHNLTYTHSHIHTYTHTHTHTTLILILYIIFTIL